MNDRIWCPNCLEKINLNRYKDYWDLLYYEHTDEHKPFICPVCGFGFCVDTKTYESWMPELGEDEFRQFPLEVARVLFALEVDIKLKGRWSEKHPYVN